MGTFGPTNGAISDQYPTLIVAAGYAFSIWGLIFLLDVFYGTRQLFASEDEKTAHEIRPLSIAAFSLNSLWMIVFSLQFFWLALAIIWASLACLLCIAKRVSLTKNHKRSSWWLWIPLSLHAGWVSLAAFLDIAQVIVAHHLFSTTSMLPWTLALYTLTACLLLRTVWQLRGNLWYTLAAVWGLVGVYVKQSSTPLSGAYVASMAALALAIFLALWSIWLTLRNHPRVEISADISTE
jgi:hypothetical protein